MSANRNDRIFLCHASEDGSRVEMIDQRLRSAGLNPWIDKKDLSPARDWDTEIRKTMAAARVVVIFVSKHLITKIVSNHLTSESAYVQFEIEIALDALRNVPNSVLVITVRLEECLVPESLGRLPQFDLIKDSDFLKTAEYLKTVICLFTDPRDGQIYKTILVGTRVWLAANLNHMVEDSYWYDDDPVNGRRYGRLYTWESARLACPEGWHIPTDSEWKELAQTFGGYRDMDEGYVGTGMKIGRPQTGFQSLIIDGESGFDARLAGYRSSGGQFFDLNHVGLYWTASEYVYTDFGSFDPAYPREIRTAWMYYFYLMAGVPEVRRDSQIPLKPDVYPRRCGLSVRCVRDEQEVKT
jgi:uncharacterized protein (TIGR02145 family)